MLPTRQRLRYGVRRAKKGDHTTLRSMGFQMNNGFRVKPLVMAIRRALYVA